jgi:hypothetical protein
MGAEAGAQIGDFENEIPIYFPSEETSLDCGGLPYIFNREMSHARSALHAVFSITQSEHAIIDDMISVITV